MQHWIVILELAEDRDAPIGLPEIERLLAAFDSTGPTALLGSDRYVLQLPVLAESCQNALEEAVSCWCKAMTIARVPKSDVVRAEVLTVREFEWECASTDRRRTYPNLLRDAVRRESERRDLAH